MTRPALLALFAILCGGCRGTNPQDAAAAQAPANAIEPPLPCAMVRTDPEGQRITRFEIDSGRVVSSKTTGGGLVRETTYRHEGERVVAIETKLSNGGTREIHETSRLRYGDGGRLEDSVYKDDVGHAVDVRYVYGPADHRPEGAVVWVDSKVVERLRFDYEGSPIWRRPLVLQTGLSFGYSRVYSDSGEGEALFKVHRFDQQSSAVVESDYEFGPAADSHERFFYGDECSELQL